VEQKGCRLRESNQENGFLPIFFSCLRRWLDWKLSRSVQTGLEKTSRKKHPGDFFANPPAEMRLHCPALAFLPRAPHLR
jgi:hypothetical protein